jgi:hypothetical protein
LTPIFKGSGSNAADTGQIVGRDRRLGYDRSWPIVPIDEPQRNDRSRGDADGQLRLVLSTRYFVAGAKRYVRSPTRQDVDLIIIERI